MPIILESAPPVIEPTASSKVPPVLNLTVSGNGIETRFGLYVIIQNRQNGKFWNRTSGVFEAFNAAHWNDYAADLYYRGRHLWGRYSGADELPAGVDIAQHVYAINDPTIDVHAKSPDYDTLLRSLNRDNWPAALPNTVAVDHNTGGTDALRVLDSGNNPIADFEFTAYLTADFNQFDEASSNKGSTITDTNGRWKNPIRLPKSTAITLYGKDAGYEPLRIDITTPNGAT